LDCDALRDDQWKRLEVFVPGGRKGKRGPRADNRRFLNALLWIVRSRGRWRYYRWVEMGVLDAILAAWRARPIWNG
jgi:transposase